MEPRSKLYLLNSLGHDILSVEGFIFIKDYFWLYAMKVLLAK